MSWRGMACKGVRSAQHADVPPAVVPQPFCTTAGCLSCLHEISGPQVCFATHPTPRSAGSCSHFGRGSALRWRRRCRLARWARPLCAGSLARRGPICSTSSCLSCPARKSAAAWLFQREGSSTRPSIPCHAASCLPCGHHSGLLQSTCVLGRASLPRRLAAAWLIWRVTTCWRQRRGSTAASTAAGCCTSRRVGGHPNRHPTADAELAA